LGSHAGQAVAADGCCPDADCRKRHSDDGAAAAWRRPGEVGARFRGALSRSHRRGSGRRTRSRTAIRQPARRGAGDRLPVCRWRDLSILPSPEWAAQPLRHECRTPTIDVCHCRAFMRETCLLAAALLGVLLAPIGALAQPAGLVAEDAEIRIDAEEIHYD